MTVLPPENIFSSSFTVCFLYRSLSCKENVISTHVQRKKGVSLLFNLLGKAEYNKQNFQARKGFLPELTFIAGSKNSNQFILNYHPNQKIQLIEIQLFPDILFYTENPDKSLYSTFGLIQNDLAESRVYPISMPIRIALQQLLDFYEHSSLEALFYTGKILEIWASVYERLSRKASDAKFAANIERAKEILESDYTNPPTMEELARLVGMSLPHFKRIFKQTTGITAYRFLRQKRMEFALALLADLSKNISEIADVTGYKSKSHFSKIFLEHYGVPPSFFRKNICNEVPDLKRS